MRGVPLGPRQRITGEDREKLSREVVKLYAKGESVRAIAEKLDRSYGNVHRLLVEAGVEFRPRGGPRKAKPAK